MSALAVRCLCKSSRLPWLPSRGGCISLQRPQGSALRTAIPCMRPCYVNGKQSSSSMGPACPPCTCP